MLGVTSAMPGGIELLVANALPHAHTHPHHAHAHQGVPASVLAANSCVLLVSHQVRDQDRLLARVQ